MLNEFLPVLPFGIPSFSPITVISLLSSFLTEDDKSLALVDLEVRPDIEWWFETKLFCCVVSLFPLMDPDPAFSLLLLLALKGRESFGTAVSRFTIGETDADSIDRTSEGAMEEVLLRAPGLPEGSDLTGDLETSLLRSPSKTSLLTPIVARYCGSVPSGPVGGGRTSLERCWRFSLSLCFSRLSFSSNSDRSFSFFISASFLLPLREGHPGGIPAGVVEGLWLDGRPGTLFKLKGSGLMALGGIAADNGGWIGVGPLKLPKPPKGTALEP